MKPEKFFTKSLFLLVLITILNACMAASNTQSGNQDFFSSLQNSLDGEYGYSIDKPILIGHYNHWQKNTELALNYISKLRRNDQRLLVLYHLSVSKPEDQPRKPKSLPMRYGTPASMGGEFLDGYILTTVDQSDTIKIYFDVEIQGETMIPVGLTIEK